MRVQSINSRNYQQKQPGFKANVSALIAKPCPLHCSEGNKILMAAFLESIKTRGLAKIEDGQECLMSGSLMGRAADLFYADRDTALGREIIAATKSGDSVLADAKIEEAKLAADTAKLGTEDIKAEMPKVCPVFALEDALKSMLS